MLEREFSDKIIQEIEKSGFPIELEIVEKLRETNILTFPNISFQDTNNIVHEIDILAIIFDEKHEWGNGPTGIQLLAECKKTEKYPWVFFSEGYNPLSDIYGVGSKIDYSTDILVNGESFNPLLSMYNSYLSGHHFTDLNLPKSRTHFEAFKKPNEPTAIYKAINSIFHGRKFVNGWFEAKGEKKEREGRTFLNHFAIILDGQLLLAQKHQKTFIVDEVNHILLLAFDTQENIHSGLLDNEIVIDVIKKEYFPSYLKLLKKDAELLNKHLKQLKI